MENKQLKIILLSCTKFGGELANELIKQGYKFSSIFSIQREFEISYSDILVKKYNFYSNEDPDFLLLLTAIIT
jgi:hypothetical protein